MQFSYTDITPSDARRQLLGLSTSQATPEAVLTQHQALSQLLIEEGYTPSLAEGRQQLLDSIADTLLSGGDDQPQVEVHSAAMPAVLSILNEVRGVMHLPRGPKTGQPDCCIILGDTREHRAAHPSRHASIHHLQATTTTTPCLPSSHAHTLTLIPLNPPADTPSVTPSVQPDTGPAER
jgi:hypothetical protein